MAKYKVPEGCNSLSLDGENIEIKNGMIETEKHHQFLVNNGFVKVEEKAPKKAKEAE